MVVRVCSQLTVIVGSVCFCFPSSTVSCSLPPTRQGQVTIEFSYQLGWFLEILASLGLVNANQHVRYYLQKDIASLQHYMETKEITTPETNLNVSHDNDEEK